MPFSKDIFLNPSDRFLETWSLVPQSRALSTSNLKTKAMYSSLSPAIPIFYLLMLSAIGMDIYLGFSVLAKSGVSAGLITGSILADLVLAIFPFLLECYLVKSLHHVVLENQIFVIKLKRKSFYKDETDEEQKGRSSKLVRELKKLKRRKNVGRGIRLLLAMLIFAIAYWKIYTYIGVLPPGVSLFSTVNGKIIIIFSILCALFHLVGSEKAFAHMMFFFQKNEIKEHLDTFTGKKPSPQVKPINFRGYFDSCKKDNTEIVIDEKDQASVRFIYTIWDDEIQSLIQSQTDDEAKRAIAITCKELQFI